MDKVAPPCSDESAIWLRLLVIYGASFFFFFTPVSLTRSFTCALLKLQQTSRS